MYLCATYITISVEKNRLLFFFFLPLSNFLTSLCKKIFFREHEHKQHLNNAMLQLTRRGEKSHSEVINMK